MMMSALYWLDHHVGLVEFLISVNSLKQQSAGRRFTRTHYPDSQSN